MNSDDRLLGTLNTLQVRAVGAAKVTMQGEAHRAILDAAVRHAESCPSYVVCDVCDVMKAALGIEP